MKRLGIWGLSCVFALVACDQGSGGDGDTEPSASSETEDDGKKRKKPAKRCRPDTDLSDEERYKIQSALDEGKLPCPNWSQPVLSIEKEGLWLDGEAIEGGTWSTGNVQYIRPLFQKLKKNRETWKSFHPNKPFPGGLKIEAESKAGADAGISAIQTAAYAGYPHFTVEAGKVRTAFLWPIPGPPDPVRTSHVDPDVFIEKTEKKGFQIGIRDGAQERVRLSEPLVALEKPTDVAGLGKWFDEHCKKEGGAPCTDRVRLRVLDGPFADAVGLVRDVLALAVFAKHKPAVSLTFSCFGTDPIQWGPRFPFGPSCMFFKGTKGVKPGDSKVSGRLPPEVIQRIVRSNFGRFRICYQSALKKDPNLEGRVVVEFEIDEKGMVTKAKGSGDMPDEGVKSCVTRAFYSLTFPKPEGGTVSVKYPIVFSPGD